LRPVASLQARSPPPLRGQGMRFPATVKVSSFSRRLYIMCDFAAYASSPLFPTPPQCRLDGSEVGTHLPCDGCFFLPPQTSFFNPTFISLPNRGPSCVVRRGVAPLPPSFRPHSFQLEDCGKRYRPPGGVRPYVCNYLSLSDFRLSEPFSL